MGQPATLVLDDPLLEMELDLFVDFVDDAVAAEQRECEGCGRDAWPANC
jgi:hypothetical protein